MSEMTTQIEAFFNDLKSLMQVIAPVFAFIGMIGLGIMYMGSSIPIISEWKRNNPQAASQVVLGLIFVLLASSVAGMISFS